MQLLANTTSPFVRIARIAMIEKGLNVEPTIVQCTCYRDSLLLATRELAGEFVFVGHQSDTV